MVASVFATQQPSMRWNPYANTAWALDFKNGVYWDGTQLWTDVSAVPGYSYSRSGAKYELGVDGTPISFAANAPGIVPGVGYWARQGTTNQFPNNIAPIWAGGSGAVVSTNTGAGLLGSNSHTISALTSTAQSGISPGIADTISIGSTRTVWFFVRGSGSNIGKTVRAATVRNGGGTYERTVEADVVLTSDWKLVSATHTFANAQTGYRAEIYTGATNGADTVEVCLPNGAASPVPGPIIVTSGATSAIAADDMRFTQPIPADGEFFVMVVLNLQSGMSGIDTRVVSFSDGTPDNRIPLARFNNNRVAIVPTVAGVGQPVGTSGITSITTAGRVALLFRRSNGKYSVAQKNAVGVIEVAPNTAVDSLFPASMNRIDIGNQLGIGYSNSPIERIVYQRGTFSDADLTAILGAA